MNLQEYIDSGILELYVYGALPPEESREVSQLLLQHPEVKAEVEAIENALIQLAGSAAPFDPQLMLSKITDKLEANGKIVTMRPEKGSNVKTVVMYLSIAASLALLVGLFTLWNENKELTNNIQIVEAQKAVLEDEIESARNDLDKTQEILTVYRDRDLVRVPLEGQQVAPNAYANVFWDRENNTAYIDAQGLPEPPEGFVYQVWSLKLDPLTPTNMGLLEGFEDDNNKVFILDNPNDSQAFGITLEPAGGSESPTLEQLYTLGAVAS